jgi:outer membrane receptor for Fe3+-dicitrate
VHGARGAGGLTLRTAVYHTSLQRDWWRQSSNSRQRPNDAADLVRGDMRNLLSTCGTEGRLRAYRTGIDSRLQLQGVAGDFGNRRRSSACAITANGRSVGSERRYAAGTQRRQRHQCRAARGQPSQRAGELGFL